MEDSRFRIHDAEDPWDSRARADPEFGVRSTEYGVRNPFSGIRSPESVLRNPFSGIRSPESVLRNPFSGIRSPSSVLRNPFSGIRSPEWSLSQPPRLPLDSWRPHTDPTRQRGSLAIPLAGVSGWYGACVRPRPQEPDDSPRLTTRPTTRAAGPERRPRRGA